MPHVADHQFMTLLELTALDGASQQIADGGEKRNVLWMKAPPLCGANAENAVGPAFAPGDGYGDAAFATVVVQVTRHLESVFIGEIGDDNRRGRIQYEPGKTVRRGG